MFDPKPTRYPYPEFTDRHYLVVKKDRHIVFDKDYPYIDTSKGFLFKRFLVRILLRAVAFPLCVVRLGLVIRGKENRKKFRGILSGGFVSVSNHVHLWDFICVMKALYFRKSAILSWDRNVNGENGTLIRLVGGIPIPNGDFRAMHAFQKAVNGYLKEGNWLHVYSEGSMWEYYRPIRPFKTGPFQIAFKAGVPVLPLAFSYREPKGLYKLFRSQGLFTLHIGEPLTFREDLPPREAVADMTVRAHRAVCALAGIDPDENVYPPVFDNTRRVDYYAAEYGIRKKK